MVRRSFAVQVMKQPDKALRGIQGYEKIAVEVTPQDEIVFRKAADSVLQKIQIIFSRLSL
jgi:hypothetical protein